jgi:hypothetical protein
VHVRFEVRYKAEKLITARSDDATPLGITFVNEGVRAKRGELEAQIASAEDRGHGELRLQRATDQRTQCRASELVI